MSDIAILKAMLKDTARVALEATYHKDKRRAVKLNESDPAGGYSVTIAGLPEDSEVVVIKADEFPAHALKTVFADIKGECKRADFVIIVNDDTRRVIIYIELKARGTTSKESEIIQQFKGARCFIGYCQQIGKIFWEAPDFLEGYDERYVSIRNISISKKPSRIEPEAGLHDRPDRMLKILYADYLQLRGLIFKAG